MAVRAAAARIVRRRRAFADARGDPAGAGLGNRPGGRAPGRGARRSLPAQVLSLVSRAPGPCARPRGPRAAPGASDRSGHRGCAGGDAALTGTSWTLSGRRLAMSILARPRELEAWF